MSILDTKVKDRKATKVTQLDAARQRKGLKFTMKLYSSAIRLLTVGVLIGGLHGVVHAQDIANFPPGGFTPVFNEVTILLAISPDRPAPDAGCDQIFGPCERVVMKNKFEAGIVQPTIFLRSDTVTDPNTGLKTQVLSLGVDSGIVTSKLFGGELTMYVRALLDMPEAAKAGLPLVAVETFRVPEDAVVPEKYSIGKIQAVSTQRDFPALVEIPVHYSFISGGRDGKLLTKSDNYSAEAKEPHIMQAVVKSIPPDPEVCVRANEWNLVDESPFLKLWIRVECFRFLGRGDYLHKERISYPK